MFSIPRWPCILSLLILAASSASGQVQTGTPPFGSFSGGPDVIDLANLNAHLSIAVVNKPGRGTDFTYNLGYDNSVWYPVTSGGTLIWQPVGNWGWRGQTDAAVGYVIYKATPLSCFSQEDNRWESYTNYYFKTYVDEYGTTHNLGTIAVSDKSVQTTCTGG